MHPIIKEIIKGIANIDGFPHCFNIADLGCSSGPNTLLVVSNIINEVHAVCKDKNLKTPQFQVCLNDLFGNHFNSIFKSLPMFNAKNLGQCFISGVPGSFYGRLFPDQSMHLFHSSCSLHWLSQMPIEFVVQLIHHDEYPEELQLPDAFEEEAYTGNRYLYLAGLARNRKKVTLFRSRFGVCEIRGKEWDEFVEENLNEDLNVLHFIEEGDDSFYVTGYDDDGKQIGGYGDGNQGYYRFQSRVTPYQELGINQTIPAEFVAGFGNEGEIMFRCEGDVFNVNVSRLNRNGDGVLAEYVFNQDNWTALCEEKELEFGDIVVFTKIRNNLINVMGFIVDGSSNTNVQFLGVTRLNAVQPAVPHEDAKDERMYHLCMWLGHREHFHERTDVFYKRFSEILAFNRLAIPAKFQGENPMHMYKKALLKHNHLKLEFSIRMDHHYENPSRTNHVNMYGEWAWFGQQCGFGYTKMLRFRLMWVVSDLEDDEETRYPVFRVC